MYHRIRHVKLVLVAVAFGLTLVLFLWPSGRDDIVQLSAKRADVNEEHLKNKEEELKDTQGEISRVETLAPRFSGENQKGEQWLITAEKAAQNDDKTLSLDGVSAQAMMNTPDEVTLKGVQGVYNPAEQEIKLTENIVATGRGYIFKAQNLFASLKDGTAWSHMPVTLSDNQNSLKAQKFEMRDNGDMIIFKGGVSVHLSQGQ